MAIRDLTKADPDRLFAEDGTVRLPLLTFVAIGWAKEQPWRALSRQPTRERAEKVMDAVRARCAVKGLGVEVRPSKSGETFGVYVVPMRP